MTFQGKECLYENSTLQKPAMAQAKFFAFFEILTNKADTLLFVERKSEEIHFSHKKLTERTKSFVTKPRLRRLNFKCIPLTASFQEK